MMDLLLKQTSSLATGSYRGSENRSGRPVALYLWMSGFGRASYWRSIVAVGN